MARRRFRGEALAGGWQSGGESAGRARQEGPWAEPGGRTAPRPPGSPEERGATIAGAPTEERAPADQRFRAPAGTHLDRKIPPGRASRYDRSVFAVPSARGILLLLLPAAAGGDLRSELAPLLERHCIGCHEAEDPAGDLDLTPWVAPEGGAEEAPWARIRRVLREGSMPPRVVRKRPSAGELEAALARLDGVLGPEAAASPARPTTLRRLNAREYANALEDLFGVRLEGDLALSGDGITRGFDTIGEGLSLPPRLLERYLDLAEEVSCRLLPEPRGGVLRRSGPELRVDADDPPASGVPVVLARRGEALASFRHGRTGRARLAVVVGADQAGDEPAHMEVRVDGRLVHEGFVLASPERPERVEIEVQLDADELEAAVAFTNDHWDPDEPDPSRRDRNLHLHRVELDLGDSAPPPTAFEVAWRVRERTAREVLEELAPLVWRGPVSAGDVHELLFLEPAGGSEVARLRTALCAMLVSPRFLFRLEAPAEEAARPLDGPELATRLAAWLWCSVPDRAGLALAPPGVAPDGASVCAEVERLLADPRAERFASTFAAQWLQLDRLEDRQPDPARFPGVDAALLTSMRRESELFLAATLREGLPLSSLLGADFTFVDDRLARHYGLDLAPGETHVRVELEGAAGARRGGVLGQAAVLTATSFPERTSPVLRGKWVLEALLDEPPPPPPPEVGALPPAGEGDGARSLRERLEEHRSDPSCASCHLAMDGFGFALEGYDAVGAWRDGAGIDDRGELPDGSLVLGREGLAAWLEEGGAFRRGIVRRLATFALGRPLGPTDERAVEALLRTLPADPTLKEVVLAVAGAAFFRERQPEAQNP